MQFVGLKRLINEPPKLKLGIFKFYHIHMELGEYKEFNLNNKTTNNKNKTKQQHAIYFIRTSVKTA